MGELIIHRALQNVNNMNSVFQVVVYTVQAIRIYLNILELFHFGHGTCNDLYWFPLLTESCNFYKLGSPS